MNYLKRSKLSKALIMVLSLVGVSAFGAGIDTTTTLGQTMDYVVNQLWSGIGMTVAGGLILASGAVEAYRTDSPKKFAYAVAAVVGLAGAFTMGPDILAAMSTPTP